MGVLKVAEHKSTRAGENQPISRHPLFPVIVALWFGALFGLASVALRPQSVAAVVGALGLGGLLPAGAGLRIVTALAMTVLGAVVGVLVARRIAAPGRTAAARLVSDAADEEVSADPAPQADATPVPAAPPAETGRRRRSITSASYEPAPEPPVETEPAPELSRILDISEFAAPHEAQDAEDIAPEQTDDLVAEAEGEDLLLVADEHFAFPGLPRARAPEEAQVGTQAQDGSHDRAAEEIEATREPATSDEPLPVFSPAAARALDDPDTPLANLNSRLFETYSRDLGESAGEPAPSLFPNPHAATARPGFAIPAPAEGHDEEARDEQHGPADVQAAAGESDAYAAVTSIAPHPVAHPADLAQDASGIATPATGTAASRIATAELDDLSPIELLERLALAMAHRRATALGSAGQRRAQDAALPGEVAPPAPHAPAPHAPEPLAGEAIAREDDPRELVHEEEPREDEAERDVILAVPTALRPVDLDGEDDEALPGYVPPRHIGLVREQEPAPAGDPFSGFDEPDADDPRWALGDEGLEEEGLEEDALEDGEAEGWNEDEDQDGADPKGYSSLLAMPRPASARRAPDEGDALAERLQDFVRIHDPEDDDDASGPSLVIFPGAERARAADAQGGREAAPGSDAGAGPPSGTASPPLRPFDPPAGADTAQHEAAGEEAPVGDGFEPAPQPAPHAAPRGGLEQSLRAALEKAQRRSGAG